VLVDEACQNSLAEQPHQRFCVPRRQGMERPVAGEPAIGGQNVEVDIPLEHIAGGSDGDHDPGPRVGTQLAPHVLAERLRAGLGQIAKKLSPLPKDPTEQAWHGEDNVTMRDGLEHLFAQPFGPQNRALLLA